MSTPRDPMDWQPFRLRWWQWILFALFILAVALAGAVLAPF